MTPEPSVDVLAAQVREALHDIPNVHAALDVLVGYAKRAEELEAEREKWLDGSLAGMWEAAYKELHTQNGNLTTRLIQQRREIRQLHLLRREEADQRG